ncbi:unnamed protein product [Linum trigynum]|uniref:Uncharacterized protein n=1 Tax=Linum trigynum TaxID=586398 RepID=A0AAV2DCK4_9ROSI
MRPSPSSSARQQSLGGRGSTFVLLAVAGCAVASGLVLLPRSRRLARQRMESEGGGSFSSEAEQGGTKLMGVRAALIAGERAAGKRKKEEGLAG